MDFIKWNYIYIMEVLKGGEKERDREIIWINNGQKLPKSEAGNGHSNSEAQDPNQDELEEAHTKIHDNQTVKRQSWREKS